MTSGTTTKYEEIKKVLDEKQEDIAENIRIASKKVADFLEDLNKKRRIDLNKLNDAIFEIQKYRVSADQMVIMGPRNSLCGLMIREFNENGFSRMTYAKPDPSRYNGILFIEDESINKIIVRSLVSNHRVELEDGFVDEDITELEDEFVDEDVTEKAKEFESAKICLCFNDELIGFIEAIKWDFKYDDGRNKDIVGSFRLFPVPASFNIDTDKIFNIVIEYGKRGTVKIKYVKITRGPNRVFFTDKTLTFVDDFGFEALEIDDMTKGEG